MEINRCPQMFSGTRDVKDENINPNLETLRNEALQENIQEQIDITLKLINRAKNVHADLLFEPVGMKSLQTLCRSISATKQSSLWANWEDIGHDLGLDSSILKCIENCILDRQDPMYNVFCAFVQKDDATLDKLFIALEKNKRFDIIVQSQKVVFQMFNDIDKIYKTPNDGSIIKSLQKIKVPFIFTNLEGSENITKSLQNTVESVITEHKYNKIVMLTYTGDGSEIAKSVAKILRTDSNRKIGVVILQEHRDRVIEKPEVFINSCFSQADYVLPIITFDYLDRISSFYQVVTSALENIDVAYATYLYTLMVNDYLRRGCKNTKIRCIIPDEILHQVQKHAFMSNPEFRAWIKLSEIHNFAEKILCNNK